MYLEATILANIEELYYAILYTKFQASEPSGSEREDVFHSFLCFSMLQVFWFGNFIGV